MPLKKKYCEKVKSDLISPGCRERISKPPRIPGTAKHRIHTQHCRMVPRKRIFDFDWYVLPFSETVFKLNVCFILTNILLALLNLNWAQNPKSLDEPLQRSMAALLVLISWASSAWYIRRGVKASGFLTAFAGVLQAWAALH